tara:strand:- start:1233 stop:2600 length:1368 start_codon:yes stop_codon:yes gene_type:complete
MSIEKKNPLVTVYITNHNYGKYIKKSINSVLNQTYKNFELIIIDDGSTDNSKNVIEKYSRNKKIKIIYQNNKGLIVSNNIAMKICRGEYITRLDADDWLDPNFLQIMINSAVSNKSSAMIFCNYYLTNSRGQVIDQFYRHEFKNVKLMDQPAHGACSLIKVKILKEIGGYDEQFKCHDGVDLWFKLLGKYKVKNINLPLFFYRQHGKSLTKNIEKIFKTRDKIFNKHTKNKKKFKNILGIIPVRGGNYGETLVALKKINNTIIIHKLIKELQKTLNIKKILVSSPDDTVLKAVSKKFKNKIIIHKREAKLARLNTPIEETLKNAIKRIKTKKFIPDLVLVVNVVCPLLNHKNFDAAINLIKIFETDEVIAVKKENDNFYFHNGKSLKPFNKNNNLSLERNEVYREIGGLRLIKPTKIGKKNNTIGHIFLDEKSSFKIRDKQDLKIAEVISKKTID